MTTSEVTIACGVLVGRKPSAFSDRASRWCIFAAERATPAGVPRSRAGEQPEAVAQPRCDLLRGERAHPGGGQLERQRHAVQPRQIRSTGAHGRIIHVELSPSVPKVVRS
jgi:hypothetical protein